MKLTNPDLQQGNHQGNHQGKKDWYNDWFRNRPQWFLATAYSNGSCYTNPHLAIFGAGSAHPEMNWSDWSLSNESNAVPRARHGQSSGAAHNQHGWGYYNSSPINSNGGNPRYGYFPGSQVNSGFSWLMNVFCDGHVTFPSHGYAYHTAQSQGMVIGEAGYRGGLAFTRQNDYLRADWKDHLSEFSYSMDQYNPDNVRISTITSQMTGQNAYGQICYNRRADAVLMVERKDDNEMHFVWFTVCEKIRPSDSQHLKSLLENATITKQTLAMPTTSTDHGWRYHNRFVLCDDLSVWCHSVINGGTHYLWRVKGTLGNMSSQTVHTMNGSNSYNIHNNTPAMSSFLVSDDQQWVCLFHHYYYYGSGLNAFFVPTNSATGPYNHYQWGNTAYRMNIAPMGGAGFVMLGAENMDGPRTFYQLYPRQTDGASLSWQNFGRTGDYNRDFSTSYNATILGIVQPIRQHTTEWLERVEAV